MPATKLLADERIKFTILTVKPANVRKPTLTELNAVTAIEAACLVYADDFTWTATDSERVSEKAVCDPANSESLGSGNYDIGFTAWRWFDSTTLEVDPTADKLFQAVKTKGTTLWGYVRRGGKLHSAAWAATDEIQLGGEFVTDTPQATDNTGLIKYRIPALPQAMADFVTPDP